MLTQNKYFIIIIIILSVLAILSKERAGMVCCLIPIFDLAFIRKKENFKDFFSDKKRLYIWIGLSVLLIIYIILRMTILNFGSSFNFYKTQNIYSSNISVRIYTFFYAFLNYLKFIFYPYPLHFERTIPVFIDFFNFPVIAGFSVLAGLGIFAVISYFKRRIFFFCYFWFLAALAPSSGIIPINDLIMEHWIYFSMVSVVIAFSLSLNNLIVYIDTKLICLLNYKKNIITALNYLIIILLTAVLSIVSLRQNRVYKDAFSFFSHILKYNPNSIKANNNIAMALSDMKRINEAEFYYKRAIEISDEFPEPHHNLARIYIERNNINAAIEEYYKALKINPGFVFSHQDLANIFLYLKNKERADYHIQKVNEILGGK